MNKLSAWTNPRSGEIRIYVNSPELRSFEKVWIVQSDDPIFGFDIQSKLESRQPHQRSIEILRSVLAGLGVNVDNTSWDELVQLAAN